LKDRAVARWYKRAPEFACLDTPTGRRELSRDCGKILAEAHKHPAAIHGSDQKTICHRQGGSQTIHATMVCPLGLDSQKFEIPGR
jgi:hypothetical protein